MQFINGWRYLLSFLSNSSFAQSGQVAISGETNICPSSCLLSAILNPESSDISTGLSITLTLTIADLAGASASIASTNLSNADSDALANIST